MKKVPPKTVKAKKNAKSSNPRNKLNVLKVNHEKLNIRTHERARSINLFLSFKYLEENRLNPITSKPTLIEKIGSKIIEYNMK